METLNDIINSVKAFSPEERTELVCAILDDSCLDPHQVYPCLELDASMVDKLADNSKEFFESEYFHRMLLDSIPTETIREFVNKFNVENQ